jgi:hypothetical protein
LISLKSRDMDRRVKKIRLADFDYLMLVESKNRRGI